MTQFLATLENCRFCLMCTHVAPIAHVTKQEALTPHGIALTITSQRRGLIEWNEETAAIVFSEVDGGNSRAHCVNNQPFEEAVAEVRAKLVAEGFVPTAVSAAITQIQTYETPFAHQHLQPVTDSGSIALFVGDEAPYLWPDALTAALTLLKSVGVEPVLIGYGRNNGLLPQSMGYPEIGRQLAQKNLDELAATGAKTLLVLSAGDYFAWNQVYEERLELKRPSAVEIIELTSYLAEQNLSIQQAEDDGMIAYVDPTHAVRHEARHDKVRQLVTAVAPRTTELFFRRERALPVGSTHLQFSSPQLAAQLTKARLQDAQNSGAKTILCEDPATLYHLNQFADDYDLKVGGLYEFLTKNLSP